MIDRLKNIKKRYILFVLILLLSLFSFLLQAGATSIYDDSYRTVEEIEVHNPAFASCDIINISSNWYQLTNLLLPNDNARISFNNAIENGSWGVSVQNPNWQNLELKEVLVFWNEASDGAVNFNSVNYTDYEKTGGNTKINHIRLIQNANCDLIAVNYNANSNGIAISSVTTITSGAITQNAFIGGQYNVNYPANYAGTLIRSTYTPPNTYYPQFDYSVQSFNFNANYLGNVPYQNSELSNLRWRVVGKDLSNNYTDILYEVVLDETALLEYQFASTGDYEIWVDFEISPPGLLTPPDKVATTVQRLAVDGSSYTSSTLESECQNGVCNQPTIYEDCSLNGLNIGEAISCAFRNFGTFLRSMLLNIFIPKSSFVNNYFADMKAFFEEKLGLLVYPIFFISDFIGDIITTANTPSCTVNPGGTFFGATPSYDFCIVENSFGTAWTAITTFIRAGTVFVLAIALYRKLMTVLKGSHK
jgi:hypothetical protein